jgi:hypothetical protein
MHPLLVYFSALLMGALFSFHSIHGFAGVSSAFVVALKQRFVHEECIHTFLGIPMTYGR